MVKSTDTILGFFAYQLGFIEQEKLGEILHRAAKEPDRTVEQILADEGLLDDDVIGPLKALARCGNSQVESKSGGPTSHSLRLDSDMEDLLEEFGLIDPRAKTEAAGRTDLTHARTASVPMNNGSARFAKHDQIAEGGLGVVYRGEDRRIPRAVALKEMKPELAENEELRWRFENEARITGHLEHPGIIPIYDRGQNPDGTLYYAMRLIGGQSLQAAIAEAHADASQKWNRIRRLLPRFIDVCNTIGYAHSRGFLHRDIKPANVMLGEFGETIVVDWGLARRIGHHQDRESSDDALVDGQQTTMGALIGTAQFMSPEQARGIHDALTERSDVFGLGATLFFLLTGELPRDLATSEMTPDSLRQVLRDVPVREIADVDATVPKPLAAICQKAMAHDPTERYESCQALVDDLQNWLDDLPVSVQRETPVTNAGRWLRKNRSFAGALLAAVLFLTAALAGTSLMYWRAEDARIEAKQTEQNAVILAQRLATAFRGADPTNPGVTSELAAGEILATALDELLQISQKDDSLSNAILLSSLGESLHGLGDYGAAATALRRAWEIRVQSLGKFHRTSLESMASLAYTLQQDRKLDEAIPMLESCVELCKTNLGENDRLTLESAHDLATGYWTAGDGDAIALLEDLIPRMRTVFGSTHRKTLSAVHILGLNLIHDRWDEAIALLRPATAEMEVALGADDPIRLASMDCLALALFCAGRDTEAVPICEEALRLQNAKMGRDHPESLQIMSSLVVIYRTMGRLEHAMREITEGVALAESRLGSTAPNTLYYKMKLSECLLDLGRPAEAAEILRETLSIHRSVLPADHGSTLSNMSLLGEALTRLGDVESAIPLLEHAASRAAATIHPESPLTLDAKVKLAFAHKAAGRIDEARDLLNHAATIWMRRTHEDHPQVVLYRALEADCRTSAGNATEAVGKLEAILERLKDNEYSRGPTVVCCKYVLARAKAASQKLEDAKRLLREITEDRIRGDKINHRLVEAAFDAQDILDDPDSWMPP